MLNRINFLVIVTSLCLCLPSKKCFGQLVWTQQISGSTSLLIDKVDFVDENNGFTLMYPNKVLSTTNGGVNWNPHTITGTSLNSLSFIDAQTGWVLNYDFGRVYKTQDGGSTWVVQYNNTFADIAYDIHFIDENRGWVQRLDYTLFTVDGGNTWDSVPSPSTSSVLKIQFLDANIGYSLNPYFIFKSLDGGHTWQQKTVVSGSELLSGFYALDENHIWAVGENGLIRYSDNGGDTWVTQNSGISTNLKGIAFYDNYNGVAVGLGGIILTTSNGGTTWVTNVSGVTTDLYQLDMITAGKAWVTGASGVILNSTAETDLTIESYLGPTVVCANTPTPASFEIKNAGYSPITTADFALSSTDGTILNYTWNGDLPFGSTAIVTMGFFSAYTTDTYLVTLAGDAVVTNNTYSFNLVQIPPVSSTPSGPHSICPGDSVEISISGGLNYSWLNLGTASTLSNVYVAPQSSFNYIVAVTDSYGCVAYDTVVVEVKTTCDSLDIPTNGYTNIAFSPNGDDLNDYLHLEEVTNTTNSVQIYNRWGDIIVSFENYDNETVFWDGKINGQNAVQGTYYYTLDIPEKSIFRKGWIQVIY